MLSHMPQCLSLALSHVLGLIACASCLGYQTDRNYLKKKKKKKGKKRDFFLRAFSTNCDFEQTVSKEFQTRHTVK